MTDNDLGVNAKDLQRGKMATLTISHTTQKIMSGFAGVAVTEKGEDEVTWWHLDASMMGATPLTDTVEIYLPKFLPEDGTVYISGIGIYEGDAGGGFTVKQTSFGAGDKSEDTSKDSKSPGFELSAMILSMVVMVFIVWSRKKR